MPTYPNLPGAYMYDLARDGTIVTVNNNAGTITATLTAGEVQGLASWSQGGKGPSGTYGIATGNKIVAMFPNLRQISAVQFGVYLSGTYGISAPQWTISHSPDTTNGTDGTWTSIGTSSNNSASSLTNAQLRVSPFFLPVSATGVKAVRAMVVVIGNSGTRTDFFQAFSIWGTTQPVGLVMWHATNDVPLLNSDNSLDRGDIHSNAAPVVQQFRIKNTGSQTANAIVVGTDTTTTLTTLDTDTTVSLDGTNFAATQTIASIAAGAVSGIVYMRRGTPTDVPASTRAATLRAVAGSWT